MYNPDDYIFFWQGEFQQCYKSEFKTGDITFVTAEQYMMYHKSILFSDYDIADKILLTNNAKEQKALGGQVKGFNEKWWNKHCDEIVFNGNVLKFTQNTRLFNLLMATGDRKLVEASPYDSIWGIGLDEDTARITPPEQWKGKNKLGIILDKVKLELQNAR